MPCPCKSLPFELHSQFSCGMRRRFRPFKSAHEGVAAAGPGTSRAAAARTDSACKLAPAARTDPNGLEVRPINDGELGGAMHGDVDGRKSRTQRPPAQDDSHSAPAQEPACSLGDNGFQASSQPLAEHPPHASGASCAAPSLHREGRCEPPPNLSSPQLSQGVGAIEVRAGGIGTAARALQEGEWQKDNGVEGPGAYERVQLLPNEPQQEAGAGLIIWYARCALHHPERSRRCLGRRCF